MVSLEDVPYILKTVPEKGRQIKNWASFEIYIEVFAFFFFCKEKEWSKMKIRH